MSVLAGVVDFGGRAVSADAMASLLGFVVAEREARWCDETCALYARRLVVQAADRTDALLAPGEGGIVVAIEGHVFNLDGLRRDLGLGRDAQAGAVLAAAWQRWGDGFPVRLNGEFALAAWNPHGGRLLLAADHVASVPLYWTRSGDGRTAFATELSAVIAARGGRPEPDWAKIADFVAFTGREPERTFIKAISAVAPGSCVIVSRTGVATRPYWSYGRSNGRPFETLEEGLEAARNALESAVRVRVPDSGAVASHLTGGLDSSAVSALAARQLGDQRRLHLFSIVPWLPGLGSGRSDADYIPAFLRDYPDCRHEYVIGTPGPSRYEIPGLHNGPLNLQLTPAIRTVSELACKAGCRVMLTGWGGEAGATYPGYGIYRAARLRGEWRWLWSELGACTPGWRSRGRWLRNVMPGRAGVPHDRAPESIWPMLACCLRPEFVNAFGVNEKCLARRKVEGDPLQYALARMLAGILRQGRLSAWSFQARAEGFRYRYPLLDRIFLETVQRLPPPAHIRGGRRRELIRFLMGARLPVEIYERTSKVSPTVSPDLLPRTVPEPSAEAKACLNPMVQDWPTQAFIEARASRQFARKSGIIVAHMLDETARYLQALDRETMKSQRLTLASSGNANIGE